MLSGCTLNNQFCDLPHTLYCVSFQTISTEIVARNSHDFHRGKKLLAFFPPFFVAVYRLFAPSPLLLLLHSSVCMYVTVILSLELNGTGGVDVQERIKKITGRSWLENLGLSK